MTDRLVSVGDDYRFPPPVRAAFQSDVQAIVEPALAGAEQAVADGVAQAVAEMPTVAAAAATKAAALASDDIVAATLTAPKTAAALTATITASGPTDTLKSGERHARAYAASTAKLLTPTVNAAPQLSTLPLGLRYRLMGTVTVGAAPGGTFGANLAAVGVGSSALAGFKGIGVDVATNRPVAYDGGVVSLSATALPAGQYALMVIVDEAQVSLVIRAFDGSREFRRNLTRPTLTHFGSYWTNAAATLGQVALNPSSATIQPRSIAAGSSTSTFSEDWADKSEWSTGAPQLSGGKLYAGSGSPAYLDYPLPASATLTATATLTIPADLASGLTMLGLDYLGTANTGMIAVGVTNNSRRPVYWRGSGIGGPGATADLSTTQLPTGDVAVSVQITATDVVLTVGGFSQTVARSALGATALSLRVWNSDPRQLTGAAIGPLALNLTATNAAATFEGGTQSVVYLRPDPASTSRVRIELPKTYVSDKPAPLVIYCHGSGRDAASGFDDTLIRVLTNGLTQRGYIVAHSDAAGLTNWGNPASVADYVSAYRYVRDHYGISAVYLIGQSMGGLASLTILARKLIPNVLGWFGVAPVTNLRGIYDGGLFSAAIEAAYGMTAGAPDWTTKTAGSDPNLRAAAEYAGTGFRVLTAVSDDTVPPASNAQAFLAKVAPVAPEASLLTFPGTTHIGSEPFDPADADAFFKRCATY